MCVCVYVCVCESVTKSKYQFLFYHDYATANGDRGIFSTMAAKLFKLYGTIVTYKCTYVSCDLLQYITERIILFCEQSYVNQLFFLFFQVFQDIRRCPGLCQYSRLNRGSSKNLNSIARPYDGHSAHLTSVPVGFRAWVWWYTCLLLLILMLWYRQAIFKYIHTSSF